MEKDENGAASLLDKILAILDTPRFVRVRALSLRAHIEFERRITQDNPDYWNIDALYRAAKYADEACALGFVSSGVLDIGITIERAGFRRQEDCRFPQWSTERFERLTDLWRVVDRRKAEIQRKESKRQGKLKKDPNAYICAARGCGVEATHKAGLQRCSGKCRKEGKPAYCSKECQKKVSIRAMPFHCIIIEAAFVRIGSVTSNFAATTRWSTSSQLLCDKLSSRTTLSRSTLRTQRRTSRPWRSTPASLGVVRPSSHYRSGRSTNIELTSPTLAAAKTSRSSPARWIPHS